jgi:hypothetical protein
VTIEKGGAWGTTGELPPGSPLARTDADLRRIVTGARRSGRQPEPIRLVGGDLWRTLGGTSAATGEREPATVALVPVDVVAVLLDGRLQWFVAHMIARHSWWRGRIVAAMNAEYLGRFDVAPRSHPGDGRVDVLEVDPAMSIRQRLEARRRLHLGTHVPHPAIRERRTQSFQERFDPPLRVTLDGEPYGDVRDLSLRVEPDAVVVAI